MNPLEQYRQRVEAQKELIAKLAALYGADLPLGPHHFDAHFADLEQAAQELCRECVPEKKQPSDPKWHNRPHTEKEEHVVVMPDGKAEKFYTEHETTILKDYGDGWNACGEQMLANLKGDQSNAS